MTIKEAKPKTYLSVPYEERAQAKAAGALWDKKEKAWFTTGNKIADKLKKWLPENQKANEPVRDHPQIAFGEFLRSNGAVLGEAPMMDGQWHRVRMIDDTGKEQTGSYRGFLDGVPNGQFKNFRGTDLAKWIGVTQQLSPSEKAVALARMQENRAFRKEQLDKQHSQTAKRAFGIWANISTWANKQNSPYLAKKDVPGFGVKLTDDGRMIVPLRDETGRIWSLQFVGEKKTYLTESRKEGLFHLIDPDRKATAKSENKKPLTIVIAEGYATGADVQTKTKFPTAIAFDGDNLVHVAKAIRQKHPAAQILIAADDDHHLPKKVPPLPNKGLVCAQRAADAVGGLVVTPRFTEAEKQRGLTDWNDLKHSRGDKGMLEALRTAFGDLQRENKRTLDRSQGRGLELAR